MLTFDHLACVHGSVTCYYHPGGEGAVDILQVLFHPLILSGALSKVMFCAHHDEMHTGIIKAVPNDTKYTIQ